MQNDTLENVVLEMRNCASNALQMTSVYSVPTPAEKSFYKSMNSFCDRIEAIIKKDKERT